MTIDEEPSNFSAEVGSRLRALRRSRRLSLDDIERASGGRWSASALGAYERGFRNLSLPRLRELADFYSVPIAVLVGEADLVERPVAAPQERLVLDLGALARAETDGSDQIIRYVQSIILERGDYNGRVLSIRRDDVRALCALLNVDEVTLLDKLEGWGALAKDPRGDGVSPN